MKVEEGMAIHLFQNAIPHAKHSRADRACRLTVGRHQNSDAMVRLLLEKLKHARACLRIEASGGFIRQNNERPVRDGSSYRHPLHLSSRQTVGHCVSTLTQSYPFQQLIRSFPGGLNARSIQDEGNHHVLSRRECGEEIKMLEYVPKLLTTDELKGLVRGPLGRRPTDDDLS
jgi:hypothetical protein